MSPPSNKQWLSLLPLLLSILSFNTPLSKAKSSDTISAGQSLSWNQTIISQNGVFELGFFTPGNSKNYYIGIWYKIVPNTTVVWVANRDQPISNPSFSELKLFENGNLVLQNQTKTQFWSTNSTSKISNSTIAMLLDNGNFVVRDLLDLNNVIWQSFDYPTDHWLPGGKVGFNKLRNKKISLNSWRSHENPAHSLFSVEVEPNTCHVLKWNESKLYWNSGEWDGKVFKFVPEIAIDFYIKNITYVTNENESYFTYESGIPNSLTRFVLGATGQLMQFAWRKGFTDWQLFWTKPPRQCDVYGFCGGFSVCSQNVSICECIQGFKPRTRKDWELGDHSGGCERKSHLQCGNGGNDTFSRLPNTKFPVDSVSLPVGDIEECKQACLGNCSCTAYAYDNGCLVWKGKIFNLQKLSLDDKSGRDFHVRIAQSEMIENRTMKPMMTKKKIVWFVLGGIGGFFLLFGIFLVIWRGKRKTRGGFEVVEDSLMVFKYREMKSVTKNFSEKLGEGGFGSVFKGVLPNFAAIAVKRLKSQNGNEKQEKQFRAELSTIGMIQHINLVRLRGFCLESTRRFLIYDYMSNGSLEAHLFQKASKILDWKTRYGIAIGTARGLAYLHEKCRDCIIHCDIKPENILLDTDYSPKVADFGLAKLVGHEFSRVLTTMRGTRGYLAPEWISGEPITPRADVFSYGMVLFEIISGRRNIDILNDDMNEYFPYLVAKKLIEGKEVLSLLDCRLDGKADEEELLRACKVACWCIQQYETDRLSMGYVVQVLEGVSEVGTPPVPRFFQDLAESSGSFRSGYTSGSMVYPETSSNSFLTP